MFGLYALPSDDLIFRLQPTLSSTVEDPAYPLTNWYEVKPAKPAKLTAASGRIIADFGVAVNVAAVALLYHNLDENFPVYLEWNSVNTWSAPAGSLLIPIPAATEDSEEGFTPVTVSPWVEVPGSPTMRYWSLVLGGSGSPLVDNSFPIKLGRWSLLGALRDLGNDVRWGVVEEEEHHVIEHDTDVGVETGEYGLEARRRNFVGEFALRNESPDEDAQELISLFRSARMKIKPWILIPDQNVNDAWIVRFMDDRWSRTRETINHNIFPYRVKELARGLDWP